VEQVVINFKHIRQVAAPHYLYNGSRLCTGGISDDDVQVAASAWWHAARGVMKAAGKVCCLFVQF